MQMRSFKQTHFIFDRLSQLVADMHAKASVLPEGLDRSALLERIAEADAALRMQGWANSRELQPPK
jgi:hypothetical protein